MAPSEKTIEKYKTLEGYYQQLAYQRTPEYKLKRNARLRRKRTETNLKELFKKEAEAEYKLKLIQIDIRQELAKK